MTKKLFSAVWCLDASDKYFLGASSSICSCMKYHGDDILYHIITSKELTAFQKDIVNRITRTYGQEIEIVKLNGISAFKGYSRSWPPIVYARLLIGDHFKLPYMAIDADVLFFSKIDDISFLTPEKPIASLCDSAQIKKGKMEKLNNAFGSTMDKYLNGGVLFVLPGTIHKRVVPEFLKKHGKHPALEHNEQDIVNIIFSGKTQYYPDGYGLLLYNRSKKWKNERINEIMGGGGYKFVHIFEKQWVETSVFYELHKSYLYEIGINSDAIVENV
ncbi:MAG: hypothetical protein FWH12_02325 [Treponema sp.]|nr:hypothetical protein [Treponema sp.]